MPSSSVRIVDAAPHGHRHSYTSSSGSSRSGSSYPEDKTYGKYHDIKPKHNSSSHRREEPKYHDDPKYFSKETHHSSHSHRTKSPSRKSDKIDLHHDKAPSSDRTRSSKDLDARYYPKSSWEDAKSRSSGSSKHLDPRYFR